jgi:hypothetical protein
VIGVLRVNGALPVRAFSMRPNLEAPGHDTEKFVASVVLGLGAALVGFRFNVTWISRPGSRAQEIVSVFLGANFLILGVIVAYRSRD